MQLLPIALAQLLGQLLRFLHRVSRLELHQPRRLGYQVFLIDLHPSVGVLPVQGGEGASYLHPLCWLVSRLRFLPPVGQWTE